MHRVGLNSHLALGAGTSSMRECKRYTYFENRRWGLTPAVGVMFSAEEGESALTLAQKGFLVLLSTQSWG